MSSRRSRGFTLVEVLIVVVIMAVLAAVVIPQLSSSTDDALRSTGEFNASTMRSIIQTYKAQHLGANPQHDSATKSLPGLVNKTRVDGQEDPNGAYGPYLVEFPENPYTKKKDVNQTTKTTLTAGDVTGGGWLYNVTTGQIFLDSNPGFDF
jgi:prepilin-type N-terminal cleavage/methylation domain-containing protein